MKESVLGLEAAVEIAVKWKKQCGEQELQVVWKYKVIYHIHYHTWIVPGLDQLSL